MKYSEVPQAIKSIWEALPLDQQAELVACLARNKKQIPYRIKTKAEVNKVAPILAYIQKYSIPHKVLRDGANVVFSFRDLETRNRVLIGRMTL